jgi:hypothetical protein
MFLKASQVVLTYFTFIISSSLLLAAFLVTNQLPHLPLGSTGKQLIPQGLLLPRFLWYILYCYSHAS